MKKQSQLNPLTPAKHATAIGWISVEQSRVLADSVREAMSRRKREETEWRFDEHGKVSNRALAEMIVSSLYYAKPPVISEADYDRAVEIVEEEINIVEIVGKDLCERQRRASQWGGGHAEDRPPHL